MYVLEKNVKSFNLKATFFIRYHINTVSLVWTKLTTVQPTLPFSYVDDFLGKCTKEESTFFSLMVTYFCTRDSR